MKDMIKFVMARPENVEYLRSLAHRSEAHWGYDKKFMEAFDREFNITKDFVLNDPVYMLFENLTPVAFWGLRRDSEIWELEYFYVSEQNLGKGYGKQMWDHMTNWCKEHGAGKIHFVTSHQATGFYEKMGAVKVGVSKSIIDGRSIPHFICELL